MLKNKQAGPERTALAKSAETPMDANKRKKDICDSGRATCCIWSHPRFACRCAVLESGLER